MNNSVSRHSLHILLSLLLVLSLSSLLGGSRTNAFGSTGFPTRKALPTRATCKPSKTITERTTILFSSPDDNDDDDGWGSPSSVGESNFDRDRKVNELRSLQEQASNKAASPSPSSRDTAEPPERDMFIPIMAVVSLAGLFGAYGYETLRLASRGELYLPF